MEPKTRIAITTAAVVATAGLAAGGAAAAVSTTSDDSSTETAITGPALDQASRAALDYVGEGAVTGTEVGDEESLYEVEVTRDDGTQVDVQLDEGFTVVSSKADIEDGK
ncbi:PepSY domain-containing protein [Microbacterium sp. P5_E9]